MIEYLEDRLDSEAISAFAHALRRDPVARHQAAEALVQNLHLSEIGQRQAAWRRESVVPTLSLPLIPGWRSLVAIAAGSWRRALAVGGILALAALVLRDTWAIGKAAPRIDRSEGTVTVQRKGRRWTASPGTHLRLGDRVSLAPGSAALLTYPHEATRIWLTDAADVLLRLSRNGKTIDLFGGVLSAQVAPQPATTPMCFKTPTADATVLGTDLRLSARSESTRLDVWRGHVRLASKDGHQATEVKGGEFGVVTAEGALLTGHIQHGVLREYWITTGHWPADDLSQASVFTSPPTGTSSLPRFEADKDWGEGFVARFRAVLQPPVTGVYRFWIVADDAGELWLSHDGNPAHKTKICSTSAWTSLGDWDRYASQQSSPVALEQGRTYYLEALQSEWAGGDYLAIAWLPPGRSREIIPGEHLFLPDIADASKVPTPP